MIDFEKIISKYDEKASDAMDMTDKVGDLYSELCEAISDELEKISCHKFLAPAISAALEVSARGLMLPLNNNKFLCKLKDVLIDSTNTVAVVLDEEHDNE